MSEPFEPTAHAAYPGLSLRRPWTPAPLSAYRVIAFDMDSTLVAIETLDEMAALMGRGAEVAAITEAAMRGRSATTSKACASGGAACRHAAGAGGPGL